MADLSLGWAGPLLGPVTENVSGLAEGNQEVEAVDWSESD